MVGPDFKPPEATVPEAYKLPSAAADARTSQVTAEAAQIESWWKSLNDPTLDDLIVRAIISNLDVQAATSRIRQARASRGIVAGGLWPQVDARGTAVRSRQPVSRPDGSTGGSTGNLFQVGLDAAWELDVFGGVRRGVEAADAEVAAAFETRRDVLVTLTSEVALNYVALRGLQDQLRVANDNLVSQQRTVEITRRRFEGGFTSRLDLSNAQAQVAATRASIPPLVQNIQQAIFNLGLLIGREPTALEEELVAAGPIPALPTTVPAGLPSDLLRRRPDIRAQEARLHAATAQVGVATAELFPKFSLTGSLGLRSPQLGDVLDAGSRTWSIGPSVSWSLLNGGTVRSNIALSEEAAKEAFIGYQQAVLVALGDVQSALEAYAREQERRAALVEAVDANRRSVATANELYSGGQTDFLSVLVAERALFNAEDALAASTATETTNLIALYKALGGGWEGAEPALPPIDEPAATQAEPASD
jgi:NodT family efflux transporter outer membrane factor (OMF) lipoprotein